MPRFVNIAQDGKNPVHIDADAVSVIFEAREPQQDGQVKRSAGLSSIDASYYAWLDIDNWGVEPADAVSKLAAHGADFVELPSQWPDNGRDDYRDCGRYFVNPAAFEYIITDKPRIPKGGTEETCSMLLSLAGHGMIESYNVPVRAVDELMAKVALKRPDIAHVDLAKATARFYETGRIAYDSSKIATIYPNGNQVNFRFATGNVIDFDMPVRDWVNEYINGKYNRASREKREAFEAKWLKGGISPEFHRKLDSFRDGMRTRVAREFANAAAAGAPQLVRVMQDRGPLYHRFENLAMMSLHVDERNNGRATISFLFNKGSAEASGLVGGGNRAFFKTRERGEAEMERLGRLLAVRAPR